MWVRVGEKARTLTRRDLAAGVRTMPRFFFNTDDGAHAFNDEDGTDLPSVDRVPHETLALLRELVGSVTPLEPRTIVATVCDVTGAVVLRTRLSITSEFYA